MRALFVLDLDDTARKVVKAVLGQHGEQRLVVRRAHYRQARCLQDGGIRPVVFLAGGKPGQGFDAVYLGQQVGFAGGQQGHPPAYQALVQRDADGEQQAFAFAVGHGPHHIDAALLAL